MEMYDVGKDAKKHMMGNDITLTSDVIEPIEDFKIDEEVELTVKGKVVSIHKRKESEELTVSEGGETSEKEKTEPKEYVEVRIELTKVGLGNVKADRQKADKLGLDKKSLDEIEAKRNARKEASKKSE